MQSFVIQLHISYIGLIQTCAFFCVTHAMFFNKNRYFVYWVDINMMLSFVRLMQSFLIDIATDVMLRVHAASGGVSGVSREVCVWTVSKTRIVVSQNKDSRKSKKGES